jgi:hypothetical protein
MKSGADRRSQFDCHVAGSFRVPETAAASGHSLRE